MSKHVKKSLKIPKRKYNCSMEEAQTIQWPNEKEQKTNNSHNNTTQKKMIAAQKPH